MTKKPKYRPGNLDELDELVMAFALTDSSTGSMPVKVDFDPKTFSTDEYILFRTGAISVKTS